VIDTKQYRGRLWLDSYGLLWHGRHLLVSALRKVWWEADQADEVLGVADVQVAAIVAVQGASVPGAACRPTGSPSPPPCGYPTCCGRCHRSLGRSGLPGWPIGPDCASAPPPDPTHLDHRERAGHREELLGGWLGLMVASHARSRQLSYVNPYAPRIRTPFLADLRSAPPSAAI
jgi:hypothetical protein